MNIKLKLFTYLILISVSSLSFTDDTDGDGIDNSLDNHSIISTDDSVTFDNLPTSISSGKNMLSSFSSFSSTQAVNETPVATDVYAAMLMNTSGENRSVSTTFGLIGSAENGTTLTFELLTAPQYGSLADPNDSDRIISSFPHVIAAEKLSYMPPENFSGVISFDFRVSDGVNVSASAVATVTVFDKYSSGSRKIGGSIDPVLSGSLYSESNGQTVAVDISDDGQTIAIGEPNYEDGRGRVRIFTLSGGDWEQLGVDIQINESCLIEAQLFGFSVNLSSDGRSVAIGAPGKRFDCNRKPTGYAYLYSFELMQIGDQYLPYWRGDSSVFGNIGSFLGHAVSISSDGRTYAASSRDGLVRLVNDNGRRDINYGSSSIAASTGPSLSLDDNGSTVAIGSQRRVSDNNGDGHVGVFRLLDNEWVVLGQFMEGETDANGFGASISLSGDGRSIAVSAPRAKVSDLFGAGHVRVFDFNGEEWLQRGISLGGEASRGSDVACCLSVSLSSDGQAVAAGWYWVTLANNNNKGNGVARVYDWLNSEWLQRGQDIDAQSVYARTYRHEVYVSLSADAQTMSVSVPVSHDGNKGRIQILDLTDSAPKIFGNPKNLAMVGQLYAFSPEVEDPDPAQAHVFSVTSNNGDLPPWLSFDESTGVLEGIPSSSDIGLISDISLQVTDSLFDDVLGNFNIEVIDADTEAPVITTSNILSSVDEGETALGTVTANESVTWSIVGSSISISNSGAVTLDDAADYETATSHSFTITATDSSGNAASTELLTVTVIDADEEAPVITTSNILSSVDEGETALGTVTANESVTWSIVGSSISISNSGAVTLDDAADYETATSHSFTITATDSSGNAASTELLTVTVIDADTEAPVITTSNILSSVDEGETALGTVTANESVTWSIVGSSISISNSGAVTLDDAADYETATSHSFTITATDSSGNAASTELLTVTVIDADTEAPVITTSNILSSVDEGETALGTVTANESVTWSIVGSSISISNSGAVTLDDAADYETATSHSFTITATDSSGNAASTELLTVTVIDADEEAPVITTSNILSSVDEGETALGTVTANESVTWSIVGSSISISNSGAVTLDDAADYETATSYSFTITATDSSGNAASTELLTVTVIDADEEAPVITTSNILSSVDEGETALGTVTANESVTWSIVGSGISISNSGAVTLDDAADYETATSHSFTITATDSSGNAASTELLTVTVIDADENTPVKTVDFTSAITQLNMTANGDQINPSISSLPGNKFAMIWSDRAGNDGDRGGIFGGIYDEKLALISSEFVVNTLTTDWQSKSNIASASNGNFMAIWHQANGFVEGQLFNISGEKLGNQFTIQEGYNGLSDVVADATGNFWVVSTGGGIGYINKYSNTGELLLDSKVYQSEAVAYEPVITVLTDSRILVSWYDGQNTAGSDIYGQFVTSAGELEGIPFIINTTLAENQSKQAIAGLVSGGFVVTWQSLMQDGDLAGIYARVFDESGVGGEEIAVNTETIGNQVWSHVTARSDGGFVVGWVDAKAPQQVYLQSYAENGLTQGTNRVVSIDDIKTINNSEKIEFTELSDGSLVAVWDAWNGSRNIFGRTFTVIDTDEEAPVITTSNILSSVDEGETALGTVTANESVTWSIVGSGISISNSGAVTLDDAADYETATSHSFTITATDSSGNAASTELLTVTVIDADEEAPVITTSNILSSVDEGETALGTVTANESVTWSIVGSGISISNSGAVTLDDAADYETATSHSFTITATDSSGNAASTELLTVTVIDADEEAPVITTSNILSSVDEGETALGTVTANESVTWSIVGSSISISNSGAVTLDDAADYETATSHSFTITATDSSGNAASTELLTVTVIDADEEAPVITTSNILSSVDEGETALGTVTANESVTWSIVGSGISISNSGAVTLDDAADYETATSHSFTITATDSSGNAASTELLTVTVIDADENTPVKTVDFTSAITQLNMTANGDQINPSISSLPGNKFAMIWSDRAGNDGDRGGIFGGIYDEKLALISSEFVVNTLTTDWQSKSNIASASNGNFMAIWHQANGFVEGQLFNISGEKLGNQFTIQEGYNGLSDVVADATGNFWVVSTGGGIGYINKYSNTGELLLDSKVYQSEAVAYEPVITVLTDSRILVSWYDGQNTAGSDIYGQFVTSAGELEGIPFIINTTLAENQSKQAIAGLVSGGFVVTWQSLMQDGDLAGIYARVFDESGVGGEEIAVNTETIGNQVWSHVTARSDGGFVVGWVDAKAPQQVYLQSYAENGLTQGTNRVVSIDDIKTINNSEKIEFTELSDGSLVAVWDAWNGSRNIFGRTFSVHKDDENTPVKTVDFTSAITQLNMTANGDQINPSISSLPGNKFAMIWSDRAGNDGDRGGIFGGIYDEKLALISSEFVVNTLTTDWQSKSNIASASNGNFMAIWHQANGFVEGQLFNISGEKLGNQFTIQEGYNGLSDVVADATGNFWVVSTGGGIGYINKYSNTGELLLDSKVYQSEAVAYEPVITVLTDSRILVSWYDGQNTAGSDIYGQFVTSAGELEGIPFIINTTLAENQSKQAIAGLVSGGFVVTWQSLMQDGDLAGIYARVFDESGVGGEEIAVNTETIGNQVWSHVTARSDGGFVVGWVDAKAPQQVYLQSYAENGLTQGTNRVVSIDDIKTINNSEKIEFTELSDGSLVAVWDAWNGSRNIFGRTFEVKAIIETLEDSDGDGVNDYEDPFPNNSLYSVDSDSDGMPDEWETRYGLDPNDASDATSDQDNDGVTAIDEFLAGTIPSGSLDIDGNENYDALTDGLLLLRGMFGLDGSALVTGTVASDATYTESVDIESRIATLGDLADIDGNGDIDALTDGLLALRYLFGLQGDTLINGVIASDATRKTAEEVEAHLETLMPSL